MYNIEKKGWSSSITNFVPYVPYVAELPDDAVHITKYTTKKQEHDIDVWYSPSTQKVYSGKTHNPIKIKEPDNNHSSSRYFYTHNTANKNVLCRLDRLLSKVKKEIN